MNAILSVNCALLCALQRLLGDHFFTLVLRYLYKVFLDLHPIAVEKVASKVEHSDVSADLAKDRVKNILNCFLHFFLFQSVTPKIMFDLLIKRLLNSF
jgi:hypothetical protein